MSVAVDPKVPVVPRRKRVPVAQNEKVDLLDRKIGVARQLRRKAVQVEAEVPSEKADHHKKKKGKRSPSRSTSRRSRTRSRSRPRRGRRSGSRSSRGRRRRSFTPSRSRSDSRGGRGWGRRRRGEDIHPEPCKVLGVFGLSQATEKGDIEDIFGKYGNIEHVDLILDRQTGRSKGFGFVYYESIDEATRAKNHCNGMTIDGRKIRTDYSITLRPHQPSRDYRN